MASDQALAPQAPGGRRVSTRTRLIRAGFVELERAVACLCDPAVEAVLAPPVAAAREDEAPAGAGRHPGAGRPMPGGPAGTDPGLDPARARLVEELGRTADPDMALLTLIRLVEASTRSGGEPLERLRLLMTAPDPAAEAAVRTDDGAAGLPASASAPLVEAAGHRARLLAVLGASQALGDFLVAHPERVDALAPARAVEADGEPSIMETLVGAVVAVLGGPGAEAEPSGARPPEAEARETRTLVDSATAALRIAYRDRLLAVVADDLLSANPVEHMPVVGERMTRLADASLEAGLLIARRAVGPQSDEVRIAVIAMGKTGARELNYVSDVDVVYVAEPSDAARTDEDRLAAIGAELAGELARATSATGPEPPLWPLDTALRPEGKDGALVRTLASHVAYYKRWASSWEFQALLKARACAGDAELGAAYEQAVSPFIWAASQREHFVDDARAMRRRVEQESGRAGAEDRRIKLGPGGLRDVEFTVQLLQLVHGRADESLRTRPTLEALDALSRGGYVGRADAAELGDCYRALRLLEHRSQLYRLRRTHELPSRPEDMRRLGRGIDRRSLGEPEALWGVFTALRRRVRALHEEIYYRPLLGAAASLSEAEMTLSPDAARARLAAVGYLDPDGALRHIQALTEGVSRRAAIQRQLLPVIIGWIGQGPDPDNGLLSFRLLSETIGGSHWYLSMLRDSSAAARRLCHVLSGARWTTQRLAERPESIAWLDDDAELTAPSAEALHEEVAHLLHRRAFSAGDDTGLEEQALEAVRALLGLRTRELVRAALADSLDGVDPLRSAGILTGVTDAVLDGTLSVAIGLAIAERDGLASVAGGPDADGTWPAARARHAVIAMGRLGGRELTYASDADVIFVHEPAPGAGDEEAAQEADAVAKWVVRLLAQARPHPLEVDADLRPEGRQGPMSRSLTSYAEYYERWSSTWERQALLRARPCAGDPQLGRRFEELIAPLRWSEAGLAPSELREVRRLKARMEAERLPRGTDPARHLKLGPGGLSDVEWAAQVLQLEHAARVPGLRTPSTLGALRAAVGEGLLTTIEADDLESAWLLASRVRAANVLGSGRDTGARVEVLPADLRDIRLVARLLGFEPGHERELEDVYRRSARHARRAAERVVFGGPEPAGAAGGTAASGADAPSAPGTGPGSPAVPDRTAAQAGAAGSTSHAPGARRATPSDRRRAAAARRGAAGRPYPWS